jgi:Fungal Zn(2)-Cys(6) binuclear cluster domain
MSSTPKKIPFYGRRYTPRTTTGCVTCRQRRLKCDGMWKKTSTPISHYLVCLIIAETKPACTRCTKLDLECVYRVQIRWPTEGAKLGNNRIREFRRKTESSSPKRPISVSPQPLMPDEAPGLHNSEGEEDIVRLGITTDFAHKDRLRFPEERPSFMRSLHYSLPPMNNEDRLLFDFCELRYDITVLQSC